MIGPHHTMTFGEVARRICQQDAQRELTAMARLMEDAIAHIVRCTPEDHIATLAEGDVATGYLCPCCGHEARDEPYMTEERFLQCPRCLAQEHHWHTVKHCPICDEVLDIGDSRE